MRTEADLRASARDSGMRLESYELVPTPDGRVTIAAVMRFDDPWDPARFLVKRAREDASDPVVRQYALSILKACREELGESGPTRSPELLACTAAAIQQNVQHYVSFIHERTETFQSARETLELGAGDCDDHARLVVALGIAANIPGTELVFFDENGVEVKGQAIQARRGKPEPVHVFPKLAYEYAETTIGAEFGENPFTALDRLEVETGENPMAHAPDDEIGFLDFVTPGNVADRKRELDGYVTALAGDVAKCASLDDGTRSAWTSFASSWRAFMADAPGWLDSGAQGRQAAEFADAIREWQDKLGPLCGSSAPMVAKVESESSVIKTVAIAAAAIAAALAVREVAKAAR